ncbi:GTP-binding protein EngB [Methanolobus bombayensis]|uniref:GTP-binding protein EngB n=1 Tax=Methanolobus bombayensis TaxID=38023 RepID=UPI001AE3AAAA|nr:GTP-binding protein EngB [Methanolobus bombayensis]MBP1909107.1 GTP-binding protein EngB required for normal cell division [Methanolobus bombayensis]
MAKKNDDLEGINFEILFSGRSNVGKSSIIKQLTGKNVKVGKRPGVTLKPTHIRYSDLLLTDLPGFGFMSGVKDRKQDIVKDQIVRYIEKNTDRVNIAVLVIDGASFIDIIQRWEDRGEIPIDIEMFELFQELGFDIILAVNKTDKIKNKEIDATLDYICDKLNMLPPWKQWIDTVAPISAKKGDLKALKSLIRQRLHNEKRDDLFKYF